MPMNHRVGTKQTILRFGTSKDVAIILEHSEHIDVGDVIPALINALARVHELEKKVHRLESERDD